MATVKVIEVGQHEAEQINKAIQRLEEALNVGEVNFMAAPEGRPHEAFEKHWNALKLLKEWADGRHYRVAKLRYRPREGIYSFRFDHMSVMHVASWDEEA